ncbi:MAG TPA: hypothetical protein VFC63_18415 [Blastocatellia bacterium]|nr:hypothetical protein [Blastocatellia bacterium]
MRIARKTTFAFFTIVTALITVPALHATRATSSLADLTSTDQLKQRFQQDAGNVRVIALLSPV